MIGFLSAVQTTAIAAWLNSAFAGFDESMAVAVHKLYELAPGFFTPFLTLITHMGKGGIFLILLSFVLMYFRRTRRLGVTMLLAISIGALITNLTVKPLVARPRPYTWDGSVFQQFWIQMGRHTESDKSFPSGHMTAACASMIPLVILARPWQKILAALFAILMGLSRIYLCVHFPSDVLGGLIVGLFAGTLAVLIAQKLPRGWYQWDFARKKQPAGKHEIR